MTMPVNVLARTATRALHTDGRQRGFGDEVI
jgi:hypothetical protein